MAKHLNEDGYKEKFRPNADLALDREVEAALAGLTEEDLFGARPTSTAPGGDKRVRRGRIISIGKDDVFVELGGKSQGVAPLLQFEETPKVGDEVEFLVERFEPREGLLLLTRKGAKSSNVTWETLEVGQVIEGTVTG